MVDDVSEDFPAVHKLISNRAHLKTVQTVKETEHAETALHSAIDAYVEPDLAGELNQVG